MALQLFDRVRADLEFSGSACRVCALWTFKSALLTIRPVRVGTQMLVRRRQLLMARRV